MSKYKYNVDYFKKIDTPEKAYWLGFLYADGCIVRYYKKDTQEIRSMSLEITLQEQDITHLEKFRDALQSNVPIRLKTVKSKYKACRITINSTLLCKDLINLGCVPKKSLILKYPDESILSKQFNSHFIRGYFDGDGGVYYNETNCYNKNRDKYYLQYHYSCYFTGNEMMLNSIKNILEQNEIKVSDIYLDNRSSAKDIYIYGKDNIKNFKNYIYKDETINLSRKLDKFFYVQNCKDLKINKAG